MISYRRSSTGGIFVFIVSYASFQKNRVARCAKVGHYFDNLSRRPRLRRDAIQAATLEFLTASAGAGLVSADFFSFVRSRRLCVYGRFLRDWCGGGWLLLCRVCLFRYWHGLEEVREREFDRLLGMGRGGGRLHDGQCRAETDRCRSVGIGQDFLDGVHGQ